MKCITLAAALSAALFANVAFADTAANSPESATRLSESECTNLWQQANPNNAPGLTEAQSAPYVTDFKAANPDGDTTIDQNEWLAACSQGTREELFEQRHLDRNFRNSHKSSRACTDQPNGQNGSADDASR